MSELSVQRCEWLVSVSESTSFPRPALQILRWPASKLVLSEQIVEGVSSSSSNFQKNVAQIDEIPLSFCRKCENTYIMIDVGSRSTKVYGRISNIHLKHAVSSQFPPIENISLRFEKTHYSLLLGTRDWNVCWELEWKASTWQLVYILSIKDPSPKARKTNWLGH